MAADIGSVAFEGSSCCTCTANKTLSRYMKLPRNGGRGDVEG